MPRKLIRWQFILVLVALIVLLPPVSFCFLPTALDVGRDAKLQADLQSLGLSLDSYRDLNGFYPSTEQGLDALVNQPINNPEPRRWYRVLVQLPKDPLNRDYGYDYPGKHNPRGYDLYSKGRDGVARTADDLGNWKQTGWRKYWPHHWSDSVKEASSFSK